MCARFTYKLTWPEIVALYRLTADRIPRNVRARYNVCPTTEIDVIVQRDGVRDVVPMRWGLVPNWWSKPLKEFKLATFNARAETVAEKPMFRSAFKRSRCLVPMSGYYEWKDEPGGKQPYYCTRRDGKPITVAGLHDEWTDKTTGETLRSCTLLITEANQFAGELHDRMPVILEEQDFETWEQGTAEQAAALLKPASEDTLQKWPVSKRVNSSKAPDDDEELPSQLEISIAP
ncbi:MAG: SOS response-associated peptidase [Methylovirgula sp.]|jgi:putative SOS response-associated peptidase YedK